MHQMSKGKWKLSCTTELEGGFGPKVQDAGRRTQDVKALQLYYW